MIQLSLLFSKDDTLVKTKSGKTFALSGNDYVLLYPEVKETLRRLVDEGYLFPFSFLLL